MTIEELELSEQEAGEVAEAMDMTGKTVEQLVSAALSRLDCNKD